MYVCVIDINFIYKIFTQIQYTYNYAQIHMSKENIDDILIGMPGI